MIVLPEGTCYEIGRKRGDMSENYRFIQVKGRKEILVELTVSRKVELTYPIVKIIQHSNKVYFFEDEIYFSAWLPRDLARAVWSNVTEKPREEFEKTFPAKKGLLSKLFRKKE